MFGYTFAEFKFKFPEQAIEEYYWSNQVFGKPIVKNVIKVAEIFPYNCCL